MHGVRNTLLWLMCQERISAKESRDLEIVRSSQGLQTLNGTVADFFYIHAKNKQSFAFKMRVFSVFSEIYDGVAALPPSPNF